MKKYFHNYYNNDVSETPIKDYYKGARISQLKWKLENDYKVIDKLQSEIGELKDNNNKIKKDFEKLKNESEEYMTKCHRNMAL